MNCLSFLRLFQIYGARKTTDAHTSLTVPKSKLDQSTIPYTPLQNNKDIEIPHLVSFSTTERDRFHNKRNQPKSYIEKLIKNIERLNKYLHKLNEQSAINADENSSIDVYNFYQLEYPQVPSPNEHLVSLLINHIQQGCKPDVNNAYAKINIFNFSNIIGKRHISI